MKVLDLFCAHDHAFEGWFGSEDDFQSQLGRGLVQCPLCGSSQIRKGLSAPRLNFGAQAPARAAGTDVPSGSEKGVAYPAPHAAPSDPGSAVVPAGPLPDPRLQAAWLQLARHIVAHTEDVGSRFAQEARRIHYGESEERAIRGQATPQETAELLEEGVAVLPLLLPESAKETLQ